MRYVILLAIFAAASCAPLDDVAVRIKRAKEFVMYGNQQNEAKDKVKRSEDESSEIDQGGEIIAKEPVDIEPEEEQPNDVEDAIEKVNNLIGDVDESPMEPETDSLSNEEEVVPNSEEIDIPEQAEELPEIDDSMNMGDNNDLEIQKYLAQEGPSYNNYDLMPNKQLQNYGYYDILPFLRRRRSQERIFLGGKNRARILKRSRRIKRDLIYPSDRDYLYSDDYAGRSDNYNELVGYLLDLLDEKYNEEPTYNVPYGGYEEPYELEPYEEIEEPVEELVYPGYEERALENAIAKRQAGLTFVPGFKRNNFYPYFDEPESHFKAFVPQKRSQEDYADAYRRVMGLASALGQSDYYPSEYRYPEYDFRRK